MLLGSTYSNAVFSIKNKINEHIYYAIYETI